MSNTMTWTYDAETGVYKNHALSGELLENAAQKMVFVPFTDKINSFGKKMGESITLVHYNELTDPTSAVLEEDTRIPIDKLTMDSRAITVQEWGRGVEYTSIMQDLSKFDPATGAQKALTRQMDRAMEKASATAFKAAKIAFIQPTKGTPGVRPGKLYEAGAKIYDYQYRFNKTAADAIASVNDQLNGILAENQQ